MGEVSTDAMYGSASMNGISCTWDALNNTNASALSQMVDHVYAISAKKFNL